MKDSNLPFYKQIFKSGVIPNCISAFIVFFFANFFIALHREQIPAAIAVLIGIIIVAEFTLAPIANMLMTRPLSKRISTWEENGILDDIERTKLFQDIMDYPVKKMLETFAFFSAFSVILCASYQYIPQIHIDSRTSFMAFVACIFGSYNAAILGGVYSERICSHYGEILVAQGINKEYVFSKRAFGLATGVKCILFLVIPVIFANVLTLLILMQGYSQLNNIWPKAQFQIARIITLAIMNLGLCTALAYYFFNHIISSNVKLQNTITGILTSDEINQQMDTSISDQMQYNVYLLNEILIHFQDIIAQSLFISGDARKTTQDLSVVANELSAASIEQSSDVKEIVTTMEDSNAFAKNIENMITTVSKGTEITKQDVNNSFDILEQNLNHMDEINASNESIIEGIRNLGSQINKIGDIISIIKDIADQTRIIAFNAELEAVTAGDDGKNFHIVAAEIRRLANSTINSIQDIENSITDIQQASHELISSSEQETQFIKKEAESANTLMENFNAIKDSAVDTSVKTSEIATMIEEQTASFNQILVTLKQISTTIDNFAESTKTITETTDQIQMAAAKLENIRKESN
ncbi:MAG: methyl-accepting chemotaxis protein [Treponema sp.]|nr:methyl-accepting chemotaxis protein [Treponema sp.]